MHPVCTLFFRLEGFNMTIKSLQVVIAMDKACNVMEEQYRVEAKKAFEELRKQLAVEQFDAFRIRVEKPSVVHACMERQLTLRPAQI